LPTETASVATDESGLVVGGIVSLTFWCCLLVAAGLFGATVLAERIVVLAEQERTFAMHQAELLTVQHQVEHLSLVKSAFENDSQFRDEVARREIDATKTGTIQIPVAESLHFDARLPTRAAVVSRYVTPWYVDVVRPIADSSSLRWRLSLIAAGLVLFGFVFLHDGPGPRRVIAMLACPIRGLWRRYAMSADA